MQVALAQGVAAVAAAVFSTQMEKDSTLKLQFSTNTRQQPTNDKHIVVECGNREHMDDNDPEK